MFDDFVQTSSASLAGPSRLPGSAAGGRSNEGGLYNGAGPSDAHAISAGFESTGEELDPINAIETGFVSTDAGEADGLPPVFQLGRVQYAFPAPLARMTVASNILTMCLYSYNVSSHLASGSTQNPRLVRINLDDPERTEEAEVPLPPPPRNRPQAQLLDPNHVGPHKMFSDPSGRHLLLSCRSGDNFYWASGWKKARALPKLKGLVIESVAWNRFASSGGSGGGAGGGRRGGAGGSTSNPLWATTREVLLGTQSGDIFEAVFTSTAGSDGEEGDFLDRLTRRTGGGSGGQEVDKVCRHLFSLQERQPITGLMAEPFPPSSSNALSASALPQDGKGRNGKPKAVVIATTSTRIYEFLGTLGKGKDDLASSEESMYDRLFEPFRRDAVPNLKSELPGDLPYSQLHTWASKDRKVPKALAWLTGPGVYHGLLSFAGQDVGDSVIDSANLLPYPAIAEEDENGNSNTETPRNGAGLDASAIAEIPLGIALTEFHFVLLYRDRIMGISSLDDRVVFQETLPLKPHERVVDTAVDPVRGTYWVYTDGSIFELVVRDEDRDVWKVYLQRQAHETALRYAKTPAQRDVVLSSQGDRFFKEARYIQAAQCYAQTYTRTFEEIVLRFMDVEEKDAIRYYLVMRLERLKKEDLTQRMMLATWLVEIYLSRINELEDISAASAASQNVENLRLEQDMLEEELRQFLGTYRESLHERTTFDVIRRHGRADVELHFAKLVGDWKRIVRHWVREEEWSKAIDALNRQPSLELYYEFATVLMRHAPAATTECWLRQPRLQPRRLVPALLQHRPAGPGQPDHAARYLQHVISFQNNTDSSIHNLLLTLLARSDETRKELLAFLSEAKPNPMTGQPCFDLDYALRTCGMHGRQEACVRLYAMMGQVEGAVDMALGQDDVELACSCAADLAENDPKLSKKLWLRIAKHVIESKKDIKTAMDFLSRTDALSIEDVLPFFPDFALIDDFKDEICGALESYASRIESLKEEMDEASASADAIRSDTAKLAQRFVTIESEDKCAMCEVPLLDRQFYVFPCRHGFHADCLISETTRHLPQRTLRRLLELQEALSSLTHGSVPAPPPSYGAVLASQASRAAGAAAGLPLAAIDKLLPDLVSAITTGVSLGVASGRRVLLPTSDGPIPHIGRRSLVDYGIVGSVTSAVAGASLNGTTRSKGDVDGAASKRASGAEGNGEGLNEKTGGNTLSGDAGAANGSVQATSSPEDAERIEALQEELDLLVASACALCEGSVSAINRPFIGPVGVGASGAAAAAAAQREVELWAL